MKGFDKKIQDIIKRILFMPLLPDSKMLRIKEMPKGKTIRFCKKNNGDSIGLEDI